VRLLLVEDDRNLNRQIATALAEAGYAVDKAFDGEEGQYLGETEPYDAVILDLGLPGIDGVSMLTNWRRAGFQDAGPHPDGAGSLERQGAGLRRRR
jgi:two-component system OmpR family response regulator